MRDLRASETSSEKCACEEEKIAYSDERVEVKIQGAETRTVGVEIARRIRYCLPDASIPFVGGE